MITKTLKRTDLLTFHCMNHKLELAVHDAVLITTKVSRLRMFIDFLFSYYSRSPDHCRMVYSVSETLGTEIRKIGKIVDVRWLSSSYRSIDAVYDSYPVLIDQLTLDSTNPKTTSRNKAKACGMMKRMISFGFLTEVASMQDALHVLHPHISKNEQLQS